MATLFVLYIPNDSGESLEESSADDAAEKEGGKATNEKIAAGDVTDAAHGTDCEESSPLLKLEAAEAEPTLAGASASGTDTHVSDSTPNAEATGDQNSKDVGKNIVVEDGVEYEVVSWSLEAALLTFLQDDLNVEGDVWKISDDKRTIQISFLVEHEDYDRMLKRLTSFGIGTIPSTSISTFPASFHRMTPFSENLDEENDGTAKNEQSAKNGTKDETSDFLRSIKARLTVTEVVERIKGNSLLTFDFLMLIVLASIVAGLGLAENSSVVLVASMLISPLMGPILGWTFGFMVSNRELWVVGVRNEIIGLVICLVMGFLIGLLTAMVNSAGAVWGSTTMWPTPEMKSRGLVRSLWVGILIALPSGAGVALSILGGNAGSLVGVAISASLLPPAVNAGMLWAYSLVSAIHPPPVFQEEVTTVYNPTMETIIANGTNVTESMVVTTTSAPDTGCPKLENNDYEFVYSCSMPVESLILGTVSLVLTILNILCIFVMGIIVLKVKEVAPGTAATAGGDLFWKKDIKIARTAYKTLGEKERMDLGKMAKEYAQEFTKDLSVANPVVRTNHHLVKWVPGPLFSVDHQKVPHGHTIHVSDSFIRQEWTDFLKDVEQSGAFRDVVSAVPSIAQKPFVNRSSVSSPRRSRLLHHVSVDESGSPDCYFTPPHSPSYLPLRSPSSVRNRNVFFANLNTDLIDSPSSDSLKGPTATYEVPNVRSPPRRPPRGLQRLPSCPSRVQVVPAKTKTTKGRFIVTPIMEEEEEPANIAGSRRGSAQPSIIKSGENMV